MPAHDTPTAGPSAATPDTAPDPELAELLASPLTFRWADLARLGGRNTAEGTGGSLRSQPSDFEVQEIPAYLPSGEGEHLYLRVRKIGHTTGHLKHELARQLRVKGRDIGMAGQKDRHAVTEQWLSVPAKAETRLPHFALEGVEVLETARHGNKLGLGHLRGNRFVVRVRGVAGAAESSAAAETFAAAGARLRELEAAGIPNYFGPQRFGLGGVNASGGLKVLRGESRLTDPALKRFLISALQSAVFNRALSLRLERGLFGRVLEGDYAQKTETGGVFVVEDAAAEQPRAEAGEISALGTLYGRKTEPPSGAAGALEAEALASLGLSAAEFTGLRGDRRPTRIFFLEAPTLTSEPDGYTVTFALPKGSFATAVLRELMGGEVDTLPLPADAKMPF